MEFREAVVCFSSERENRRRMSKLCRNPVNITFNMKYVTKHILNITQNCVYAATLLALKGNYEHPTMTEIKTGQKLHQNLIPVKSEQLWFGKNASTRWSIYLARWAVTFGEMQNKSKIVMSGGFTRNSLFFLNYIFFCSFGVWAVTVGSTLHLLNEHLSL